jgi:integrase
MAEVIGHLRFQRFLDQQFGQLLEQAMLANQVFRLSVISQQAVQQLLGYGFLSYGHHRSWQCGSFLPGDRLHKNSYTLVYSTLLRRFNDPQRGIHVFTDSSRVDVRRYTPTAFASACRRAGIEDCTYHTLRHTFASRMVQAGLPLTDVQQILGHATIHMTLKYSHLAPQESTKKAAALLNQINRTGLPVPVM